MFYSQCLLSNKGPLGAIWVAAYCFKKLKKFQVTATDISFSVDKILQDELDVTTYRILAYLLLGVVRIYSKKVEYLFDDCNEVLIEINKFVVGIKDKTQMETLQASFYAITLPDRFELDAFDLDIVEEIDGGNLVSKEKITLEENSWGNENSKPYILDKHHYEDGSVFNDKPYHEDHLSAEGRRMSRTLTASEKLQDNSLIGEKLMDLSVSEVAGKEHSDLVEVRGEYDHFHEEQLKTPVVVDSKHQIDPEGGSEKHQNVGFSHEENKMIETCSRVEREPSYIVKSFHENQAKETEIVPGDCMNLDDISKKFHSVGEENNVSTLQRSIEKLRDNTCTTEECMDLDQSFGPKEESANLGRIVSEEYHHIDEEQLSSINTVSKGRELNSVTSNHQLSISNDGTPISKFMGASEITTPVFMAVTTPATKESARTSRKRKCIIDDVIILPNKTVKQSIYDASDLVSKRRKAPHNAFAVWKANQTINLFNGSAEPLMSCISFELRSLFYDSRQRIPKAVETNDNSENMDKVGNLSNCADFSLATHVETASQKLEIVKVLEKLDELEPLAIAPETPARQSTSARPFRRPVNITESVILNPESLLERVDKESSMSKARPLDFFLMDEELTFCGEDELEADGLSGRTRLVARTLHQNFQDQKKQEREEVIELFQLLKESTRKESARLFYEILVLKTKEFMDVRQDHAYGDIILHKPPKWEQTFGIPSR